MSRFALRILGICSLLACLTLLAPPPARAAWSQDPSVNNPVAIDLTGIGFFMQAAIPDGAGGAYVCYQSSGASNQFVLNLTRLSASGTVAPGWGSLGVPLAVTTTDEQDARLVPDGAGGVYAVWTDYRHGAANGDIYVQRFTANGTVAPGWVANGTVVSVSPKHEFDPQAVADGAGGLFVVWELQYTLNDHDIWGAHFASNGAEAGPAAISSEFAYELGPSLVSDGAAGMIVGFAYDSSSTPRSAVRIKRYNAALTSLWGNTGLQLDSQNANYALGPPHLAATANGKFMAAWTRTVGVSNTVIEYASFGSAGTAGFVNSRNDADVSFEPIIVADGQDGCFLAWPIYNGFATQSVLWHVRTDGTPATGWTTGFMSLFTPGVNVSNAGPDGAGGFVATTDFAGPGSDAYMFRVRSDGSTPPGWNTTVYGTPVSTALGVQYASFCVSDGKGGQIDVFQDTRSGTGNPSIYAQTIDRFGVAGDPSPSIASLKDVPADQGGKLRLVYNASFLDAFASPSIASYWIWRQTPATLAQAAVGAGASWADDVTADRNASASRSTLSLAPGRLFRRASAAGASYAWEYVGQQPANTSTRYSFIVPTVSDSVTGHSPYTVVMVEAHGTTPGTFWPSAVDSAYSVDNLPPAAPAPLTGTYTAGTATLDWGPNAEPDFANYRLYSGATPGFVPGLSNLVASTAARHVVDAAGAPRIYKLTAVDAHGNESAATMLIPSGTTGVDGPVLPSVVFLRPVAPNPAHGAVALRFGLPERSRVDLDVFDVSGRLVREVASGELGAGLHDATWDGADASGHAVGAGLYLVRLRAAGRQFEERVALIR